LKSEANLVTGLGAAVRPADALVACDGLRVEALGSALTITPIAGGTRAVAASIVIQQLGYLPFYNNDRVHHGCLTQGRIPTDIVYRARKMEAR
jgi:hypothetical protein